MKSKRLQKSQNLNFLVNWEQFGRTTLVNIWKNTFQTFFPKLEKLEKSIQSNIEKYRNWEKHERVA